MSFAIVVKSLPSAPPLTGNVLFYLHPTFGEKSDQNVRADHNICEIQINAAYGAFTVGIHIVKEDVKLELDLAEVEGFPLWFREN